MKLYTLDEPMPIEASTGAEARLLAPDDPEWTDALRQVDHDTYHLPEYVVLDSLLTGDRPAAFWYREGGRMFLLPLTLRRVPEPPGRLDLRSAHTKGADSNSTDAISPYGYPGPVSNADPADHGFWERACEGLRDTLSAHGIVGARA